MALRASKCNIRGGRVQDDSIMLGIQCSPGWQGTGLVGAEEEEGDVSELDDGGGDAVSEARELLQAVSVPLICNHVVTIILQRHFAPRKLQGVLQRSVPHCS